MSAADLETHEVVERAFNAATVSNDPAQMTSPRQPPASVIRVSPPVCGQLFARANRPPDAAVHSWAPSLFLNRCAPDAA